MSTGAKSDKNAAYFQALVPGRSQRLGFTNVSAYSEPFQASTSLIELFSTQDCWCRLVPVGTADVAVAPGAGEYSESFPVRGGIVKFVGIPWKDGTLFRVAVVRDSTSGNLDITEGA